jgi:hypothetical protein
VKLPNLSGKTLVNKAFFYSIVITIVAALGYIGLSNLGLGLGVLLSSVFLLGFIAIALINLILNYLTQDSWEWAQALIGAFATALFLPVIVGLFGVSTISGWSAVGLVAVFGGSFVLEYIGFWLGKKSKL